MRITTPYRPAPPPHRITSERGVTDNLPQWLKKHRAHLLGANRRHVHTPLERLK
jgi:hypothetical protein